jgi:hypothetical protein
MFICVSVGVQIPLELVEWYKFDDSTVTPCSQGEAVKDNFGTEFSMCPTSQLLIIVASPPVPWCSCVRVAPFPTARTAAGTRAPAGFGRSAYMLVYVLAPADVDGDAEKGCV